MVDSRANVADIKRAFAKMFGCSPRAAERFIQRVYEQIRQESGKATTDHKAEAYAFYSAIVGNTQNSVRDRVLAQKQLDKITGIAAPLKMANTDGEGRDVAVSTMSVEAAQAVIEAFQQGAKPPGGH